MKEAMEKAERTSGVELLKIFAILLIVLSHVAQTLTSKSVVFPSDYVIDANMATTNATHFLLILFGYCGQAGNCIFFVCSAWFLIESKKAKPKKIARMLADNWLVSVIILAAFLVCKISVPMKTVIKCIFPTIFANNWYITCYLLFYAIHPALNLIIKNLDKRQFFMTVCVMFFLYFGIGFLFSYLLFNTPLVRFIVMYFVVAFLKIHARDFCDNRFANFILFFAGIFLMFALIFLTNFLGLHIDFFSDKMLVFADVNPFLFMMAFGAMNVFRLWDFKSRPINYISSLSLLIYIIHENILVRTYLRPLVFIFIKQKFGYDKIILWVALYSLVLFCVAALLSILYKETFGRLLRMLAGGRQNLQLLDGRKK